jgi:hypothetical protein
MFTFVETAVGALLLHQATTALLFNNGSILGISGLLRQLLNTRSLVAVLFFVGMALSYVVLNSVAPEVLPDYPTVQWNQRSVLITLGTGVLVGWGTKVLCYHFFKLRYILTIDRVAEDVHQAICYAESPASLLVPS